MRNLVDFLLRYKHWLLFIALEVFSFIIFFRFNGYQGSVYFTTANDVVGGIYSFTSKVTSYINLQTVNEGLEADNVRLHDRIGQLEEQLSKMNADSMKIANLSDKYNLVHAQIVNSSLHRDNNMITIDKGEADGIHPEMAVVCSSGIVGITYLTSAHYSIVIPLLNTKSRISCRLRNTNYFGTLQWQRGAVNISYVTGVPRHAKVKEGEVVETNGYSDIFPPGIPIGQVTKITDSTDGMAYKLRVVLYTNFSTLRNVSVITNYTKPERKNLEQLADSLTQDL